MPNMELLDGAPERRDFFSHTSLSRPFGCQKNSRTPVIAFNKAVNALSEKKAVLAIIADRNSLTPQRDSVDSPSVCAPVKRRNRWAW